MDPLFHWNRGFLFWPIPGQLANPVVDSSYDRILEWIKQKEGSFLQIGKVLFQNKQKNLWRKRVWIVRLSPPAKIDQRVAFLSPIPLIITLDLIMHMRPFQKVLFSFSPFSMIISSLHLHPKANWWRIRLDWRWAWSSLASALGVGLASVLP